MGGVCLFSTVESASRLLTSDLSLTIWTVSYFWNSLVHSFQWQLARWARLISLFSDLCLCHLQGPSETRKCEGIWGKQIIWNRKSISISCSHYINTALCLLTYCSTGGCWKQAPTGHGSDWMPSEYLPACLPAYLLACFLDCPLACLLTCLPACLLGLRKR